MALGRLAELRTALREVARGRKEARRHVPQPPESGLVLEVGSGQSPHPRSDVLVDKYVADDFERPQEGGIDVAKPFVVADGHQLPFADDSFAYVIALHVLEHAAEPERFANELSRVAAAGFVQVPSSVSELTFGWPYHPWLIDREGDTLVFRPRNGQHAPFGELFHRAYGESALLRNWWAANRSLFHHSVEWREELAVRVEGESEADETAALDVERTVAVLAELARAGALRPHSQAVRAAFRCPACRAELSFEREAADCVSCGRSYPVIGETPVLLMEAAR
jgi:SAM-dependent methyltransferase